MKKAFLVKALALSGLVLGTLFGSSPAIAEDTSNKVLYVYNWTEYIPTDVLKQFTDETGIEVSYSTYESNEELYSKLKLVGGKGYDLIFPSSYYIGLLSQEHLLQKIDKNKVNLDNVIPSLLGRAYDPKNEYAIPYVYGFTTIGINTNYINKDQITSWRDLWNPKYKNLTLLNDTLDVFTMALLSRGVNPNTATDEQINTAFQDLKLLVPKVVQFNSDSPEVPYIEGQSHLGMIWTGSAFRAQQLAGPQFNVVYPKEGAILWIDNFAIPKYSANVEGAYKFINFILRPEIALEITKEMGFQTANSKVKALMPKDWQENPILFPSDEVYKKAIINNIPASKLSQYTKLWNQLRVQ